MNERTDSIQAARQISTRLSLRAPQRESLDILVDLLERLHLAKDADLQHWLAVTRAQYPTVEKFERAFPSLCWALATGVGKTRLMGAMIAWLFVTGRSRHFFILAPNLTIYEKLKTDFLPGSPKYVFKGIPELANDPPVLITGEDYETGRGVRLDIAVSRQVSGELFADDTASPHINIFNISKINARDNKKGAAKSATARVRRFQEYLGESYFEYLARLPDLVVLMDEAHRYYASAGAKAINDLCPALGIELTATPKTVGANPRQFANIVYHYPLSRALKEGYVKIPAVATRQDFSAAQCDAARLEEIKLEDGIHHHEFVKVELENYARTHDAAVVKPFMLVVAQDTAHASTLKARIEANDFFQGHYKGRVIEVHSNLSGEESDEAMQRLLAVEHDETTEIVIHVNKLKEGWDVTNLYTIVPLRASASEILTEQTIGRGLRLPYGKRTGVEAVDRLCIVAHDRFQEIIDRANDPDSIIKKAVYIGAPGDADVPNERPRLLNTESMAEILATGHAPDLDGEPLTDVLGGQLAKTDDPGSVQLTELVLRAVRQEAKTAALLSSKALNDAKVQQRLIAMVGQMVDEAAPQAELPGMEAQSAQERDARVAQAVRGVTEHLIQFTIDVPRIVVLPTREINYTFQPFNLENLDKIHFQPVEQELLLHHLEDNRQARIQWEGSDTGECRPENYIVRQLMEQDAIDYDQHADLLYDLAEQIIEHLRTYLGDDLDKLENVLTYWQRQIGDFVWTQMQAHIHVTPTDYHGKITQGFDVLKPVSFTLAAGETPRDFRAPIADKRLIRQMVFKGFRKCCYPYQKFQSVEGEWRLAQILEDDPDVLKWMKPASGQFLIEYEDGQRYEPDFVVETVDGCLIIEPKRADQLHQNDVQAKARAAARWCDFANQHAAGNGGKPWRYLLIPDNTIQLGRGIAALQEEFTQLA